MQPTAGYPDFRPRFPWWGRHLQTARNFLRPAPDPPPGQRLELPMADGSGDRLSAVRSVPAETGARPLVVLIHGLTGCEGSSYVLHSARYLLRQGYPVLRLNLRGAGPSRALCRGIYHAGRSADLHAALAALGAQQPDWLACGVAIVGYSLGGNMLLKFAAEHGDEFPMRAVVSVSAPIDLAAASRCMMRAGNTLYHRWLLDRMKIDILGGGLNPEERGIVETARTVYDLDDRFIGPHHGFADAEDYYGSCSALGFLDRISIPTLMIAAADDPWIPVAPYRDVASRGHADRRVLIAPGGGHVGFHGSGSSVPWHDRCIGRFLPAAAG